MNSYTISRLAQAASVSVHVIRDHVLRGLLHPARRTASGYGIFDEQSLLRLSFVRQAFEAGIGLAEPARLCYALDNNVVDAAECLARMRLSIAGRREALRDLDCQLEKLAFMPNAPVEAEGLHA